MQTASIANAEIKNCVMENWQYGIHAIGPDNSVTNSKFMNNSVSRARDNAFWFGAAVSNSEMLYNHFCNNSRALYNATSTNTIDNNTFCILPYSDIPANGSNVSSIPSVLRFNISNPIFPSATGCYAKLDGALIAGGWGTACTGDSDCDPGLICSGRICKKTLAYSSAELNFTFPGTSVPGNHTVGLYCNDSAHTNRGVFELEFTVPGGEEEEEGSAHPRAVASAPTNITEAFGGGTVDMFVGGTINFAAMGESHSAKLKTVTSGYVTIEIYSSLVTITLSEGESKDIDLDGNSLNDLRIELLQILLPDGARIKLTPLQESLPTASTPAAYTYCGDGTCGNGETAISCPADCAEAIAYTAPTAMFSRQSGSLFTFLIILLLAAVIYVVWHKLNLRYGIKVVKKRR